MIQGNDIYKVVAAMVPLYVPLLLGYSSIKWWHLFTKDQCAAINTLNCFFIIPFFTFEFLTHLNPYQMNFLFIAADVISKLFILIVLALWANCTSNGNYAWSITTYSLSTLNNTLVVGVPLMRAMYGELGEHLVVQSFALQSILWFMMLLFMLEIWRTRTDFDSNCNDQVVGKDLEVNNGNDAVVTRKKPSLWCLTKIVAKRFAKNPNSYACAIGLAWACVSCRWDIKMPSIMEGCILILSKAGGGTSMFCIGLFMALQEKIISCGVNLTMYGMLLRFIVGPGITAIGCFAVGLHGNLFCIAVIQAALPQSVTSFTFAKEYGLHANVLSTAVIFGTLMSLPVLIAYYAILQLLH